LSRSLRTGLLGCGLAALSACQVPVGPVTITRFQAAGVASPAMTALGSGTIAVVAAPDTATGDIELASYREAVMRELARIGYTPVADGPARSRAEIQIDRHVADPARAPVAVGLNGGGGSYGGGVGVGVAFPLGRSPRPVTTRLSVRIHDAAGRALWEGRAEFTADSSSAYARTALAAPTLAAALFTGFPGTSGETIEVK
jgi:hypothetical protein